MDRMAHTEILELSLVNWAGVVEIDVTMHRFDARWWTKTCGGGRTRDGWPANLVVGGMGKEASVMGAHRGSSSPVEKAGSWDKEAWTIFWSVGVDIVDVFVVVMQLSTT